MKKVVLVFCFTSLIYSAYSQGYWTQKASFPGPGREMPSCFAIGNKGYLGCGYHDIGSINYNDFWEYNQATNVWTQKANFAGVGRVAAVGFSINNKGYIGTGADYPTLNVYNDFWEYDPTTNVWTQKAYIPIPRGWASGFTIGTKGYIGGGRGTSGYLKDFWEWDQTTDTWTKKNNLIREKQAQVGYSLSGKGYFITGTYFGVYSSDNWEYDPLLDTWTQKADLPAAARVDAAGFSICNKGYLGTGGETPYYDDFWQFDPVLNQWIQKPNFPGGKRDDCAYFSIGNKGYIGLGQFGNSVYLSDFWEYTPDTNGLCINQPVSNFKSSDTLFCSEPTKCINFFDNSKSYPTSWKWYFPGATPDTSIQQNPTNICYTTPGTYSVKLVVNNAAGSDSITVSPMITVGANILFPKLTVSNDTIYCSHAASYQWFNNNGAIAGAIDSFYVFPSNASDSYTVYITDSIGCGRLSDGVVITEVQSIKYGVQSIRVYPNPVGDMLWIEGANRNAVVTIYNTLGEEVLSTAYNAPLNIKNIPPGIYFVRISDGKMFYVRKFVKAT